MPGFGEKFSKFANSTKSKAQAMMDTSKLNSAIRKEEEAVEQAYLNIGKCYFETYGEDQDIPLNFRQMLDDILGHLQQIEELKAKINEVQGNKTCPQCGASVELEKLFCSNCGHRFEVKSEPTPTVDTVPTSYESQAVPAQEAGTSAPIQGTWPPMANESSQPKNETTPKFCTACGSPIPAGMAFCGNCGQRQ